MKTITRFFLALLLLALSLAGVFLLQRHFVISDWIAQHQRLAEIELAQLNRFARDWQNVVLSLAQHDALSAYAGEQTPSIASREQQVLEMTFLELTRAYQPFVKKLRFIHRNGREMVVVQQGRVSRHYNHAGSDIFLYKVMSVSMQQAMLQATTNNDGVGQIEIGAPVMVDGMAIGAVIMTVAIDELTNMLASLQSFGLVSNIFIVDASNRVLSVLTKKDNASNDEITDSVKRIKALAMTTPIYQLDGDIWVYLPSKDLNLDVLLQIPQADVFYRVGERVSIIVGILVVLAVLFYLLGRTAAKVKSVTLSGSAPKKLAVSFSSTSQLLQSLAASIRQPLAQWLNTARLLGETQLSFQQGKLVSQIVHNGDWQLQQLDRIIDYANTEKSEWQLENVEFDVRHLMRDWAALVRPQCEAKGVRCLPMVHAFVPNRVKGDPSRWRQVLSIVLQRVLDVVSNGEIVIVVKVLSQDKKSVELAFDVVARNEELFAVARQRIVALLDRQSDDDDPIFTLSKRFFQRLMDNFGMDVALPEEESELKTLASLRCRWEIASMVSSTGEVVDLTQKRAVLVSENANNRQAIEQVFQRIGMACVAIDAFDKTISYLADSKDPPADVCLFDVVREDEGERVIELARRIKEACDTGELSHCRETQLVVLTPKRTPGEGFNARLAGVGAYLTKPITRTQLTTALIKVLAPRVGADAPWITRHSLIEDQQSQKRRILLLDGEYQRRKHVFATVSALGFQVDYVDTRDELLAASKRDFYACVLVAFDACGKDPFELVQRLRKFETALNQAAEPQAKNPHRMVVAAYADDMTAARLHVMPNGFDDVLPDPPSELQLDRFFAAYHLLPIDRK